MMRIILQMIVLLCCGFAVNAAKVAVIADKGLENYADLLTVELSKQKGLKVVERTDIDRVLKEQEISNANLTANYLRLGKLLKADGMVIIKKFESQKKEFLVSRLVAVNQGAVLSAFANPLPTEKIENWPTDVSAKFAPYLNKVGVSQDKAVPISILNIRAPIDTPEMRLLEKEFTLALAFRLVQEKDLFVLERWKMEKLSWEKDIDTESSPFWTGSYLLDGSIELTGKENVKVRVRLRKKDGEEKTIEATGARQQLAEITEKITEELLKNIGKPQDKIQWDSAKEAEQYFKEAEWACQSGLYDEAVSAVDNASALGLKGKDVVFIKIKSYSMLAYPTFGSGMVPWDDLYKKNTINIKSTDKHLDAAIYALETFICSYLAEKPEGKALSEKEAQKVNWRNLGVTVVLNASRVLRSYYDQKGLIGNTDKLAVLRHLVRVVVDELMKRELVPGEMWTTFIFRTCSQYIPFWYDSPQDCINAYRRLFAIELPCDSRDNDLFKYEAVEEIRNTPFVVDWTGRMSAPEPEGAFKELMDELSKAGNLKYQMISLLWYKSENSRKLSDVINNKTIDDKRKEILSVESLKRMEDSEEAIRNFVWNNREEFFFRGETRYKFIIITLIQSSRLYEPFCLNLLKYILEKCISERISLPYSTGTLFYLWVNRKTNKDEAVAIHKMVEEYKKSLDAASLKKQSSNLGSFSKGFSDYFPELAAAEPSEGLSTCKLWTPRQFESLKPGGNYRAEEILVRDNKVHLLSYDEDAGYRIIIIDLEGGNLDETVKLPEISSVLNNCNAYTSLMDVSRDFIVVIDDSRKVLKYDRSVKKWSQQPLPRKYFTSMALNDSLLYLGYSDTDILPDDGYNKDTLFQNSGILEVDLKNDTFKIIASSTRKPSVSPLDDKGNYNVLNIYIMKEGRVMFNVDLAPRTASKKNMIVLTYDRPSGKFRQELAHSFTRMTQFSDDDYLMASDANIGIYHPNGNGLDYIYKNLSGNEEINSSDANRFYKLYENTYGLLKRSKSKENPELVVLKKDLPPKIIKLNLVVPAKDIKILQENYHFDGFFNFYGEGYGPLNNELSTGKYIIFCGLSSPGFWYVSKKDIIDYISKSIADKKIK